MPRLGWLLFALGTIGFLVVTLREVLTEPGDWVAAALLITLGGGAVLIFVSVLIDRLKTRKSDKYLEVQK